MQMGGGAYDGIDIAVGDCGCGGDEDGETHSDIAS